VLISTSGGPVPAAGRAPEPVARAGWATVRG
jgi:hypothetical protein